MPGRWTPAMPPKSLAPPRASRALTSVPPACPGDGMDDEPGRLVDDQEVGVLVDDPDLDLGRRRQVERLGLRDDEAERRSPAR